MLPLSTVLPAVEKLCSEDVIVGGIDKIRLIRSLSHGRVLHVRVRTKYH